MPHIIDDETVSGLTDQLFTHARGLVPRDYNLYPVEMFAPPSEMPLIPQSEWSARIKEMTETQSRLSDIRRGFPSLDQNGHGYCWAYSTGACTMLLRNLNGLPYVRLNPHSVAAIIKGGKDEGGWCGLSAQFLREHGIASEAVWPKHSRSLANDTPAARANMALHKCTEDWVDLTRQVYDQNLTFAQVATCLLNRIPCALDFHWWSHSVCGMDLVEIEPGSFGIRILNSWTDNWGEKGTSVLRGTQAQPNGAVALRVTTASTE